MRENEKLAWCIWGALTVILGIATVIAIFSMHIHPTPNGGFYVWLPGERRLVCIVLILVALVISAFVIRLVTMGDYDDIRRQAVRDYRDGAAERGPGMDAFELRMEVARLNALLRTVAL